MFSFPKEPSAYSDIKDGKLVLSPAQLGSYHPIVHLVSDVQMRFSHTLRPERRKTFPGQINEFRDNARTLGMPTIHIGHGRGDGEVKIFPRQVAWPMPSAEPSILPNQVSCLGFLVSPHQDEDIVHKCGYDNAFLHIFPGAENKGLAALLKNYGTETVVITGGNTHLCVAQTTLGALENELNVIAVYDRCSDEHFPDEETSPVWHREQLEFTMSEWQEKCKKTGASATLSILSADECLRFLKAGSKRPARKLQATFEALAG